MENTLLVPASPIAPLSAGHDHAVVDLPFTALIDGRQFRGDGLSLVSAHVVGLLGTATAVVPRIVRLVFDFDGFAVTLVLLADVREGPAGSGEVDLDFAEPSGPHLPQLRHILNAYIAGDLVALGPVIGVAGTTPPKPAGQATSGAGRRVFQGAALGLMALVLVGAAGWLVYQRSFVQLLPELGTVTQLGETLRATASGQIAFLDTEAALGQVALAITTSSGDVLSLTMPCDCIADSLGLNVGSTVLAGEPVLHLNGLDATLVVATAIPPDLAFDMARGNRVELTLPDGSVVDATARLNATQPDHLLPVTPLDPALLGAPVQVRLIRDAGWLGTQISLARSWAVRVAEGL